MDEATERAIDAAGILDGPHGTGAATAMLDVVAERWREATETILFERLGAMLPPDGKFATVRLNTREVDPARWFEWDGDPNAPFVVSDQLPEQVHELARHLPWPVEYLGHSQLFGVHFYRRTDV
jgi:hypothetical protein